MMKSEEFEIYEDRFNGFSAEKPLSWTVTVGTGSTGIRLTTFPLLACSFKLLKISNIMEVTRVIVNEFYGLTMQLNSTGVLSVSPPSFYLKKTRSGTLICSIQEFANPVSEPKKGIIVSMFNTIISKNVSFTSGFSGPLSMIKNLSVVIARILSNFALIKPIETLNVEFYDKARGITAFWIRVPRNWRVEGGVDETGRGYFEVRGEGIRIVKRPSDIFMCSRSLISYITLPKIPGVIVKPYQKACEYASEILEKMGLKAVSCKPEGLYPSSLSEVWRTGLTTKMLGGETMYDSCLIEVKGSGQYGYVWAQTLGQRVMSMISWTGDMTLSLAECVEKSKIGLAYMRGIISSIRVNKEWADIMAAEQRGVRPQYRREVEERAGLREGEAECSWFGGAIDVGDVNEEDLRELCSNMRAHWNTEFNNLVELAESENRFKAAGWVKLG